MKVLRTISELGQLPKGCVLSIGNFDGVHIGHREIITTGVRIAGEKHISLAAMTFEPHPVAILHPEMAPGVLTPLELKSHLLSQLGADYLIVLRDTESLLRLSAEDFLKRFLIGDVKPCVVVEGEDFNFGAGRCGNIDTLRRAAISDGFEVVVVSPKQVRLPSGQTVRVSSTIIRYMLESGHVSDATLALGRPYRLIGEIVPGRGRGKELGFPTLNMKKPDQIIPAQGVYAGFVAIGQNQDDVLKGEAIVPAVYSIGQARTFGDQFPLLIEAHLLIDNADRFNACCLAMDFTNYIRPQRKFATPADLAAQVAADCDRAGNLLRPQKPD